MLVFIGTYTASASRGIYAFRFDLGTGTASAPWLAAEARNPTFLALAPGSRRLYATGEFPSASAGAKPVGGLAGYAIDPESGKLT